MPGRAWNERIMSELPEDAAPAATASDAAPTEEPTASPEPAELQRERDEYYDRLLRLTAEFDNYRKRVERERRDTSERTVASVLEELLPIVDDFERALQVEAGTDAEAYRKGVEIIHRQLMDLLSRRGVTPVEALGADFDPHLHQAVATEASETARDGEVVAELRRGYKLGDRLLRPARVKVAKA
jgi:molecular chaperone GrpE